MARSTKSFNRDRSKITHVDMTDLRFSARAIENPLGLDRAAQVSDDILHKAIRAKHCPVNAARLDRVFDWSMNLPEQEFLLVSPKDRQLDDMRHADLLCRFNPVQLELSLILYIWTEKKQ